jgi:glutamate/tyrosine decarboxylase-like PLP-dependent enzyme
MKRQLQKDFQQLGSLLEAVKKQGVDYLKNLGECSTVAEGSIPQQQATLNEKGIGGIETMHSFNERFGSLMVASSGPRYLGFVTGGSTPAAIMGDWLVSVYDQNTQSIKGNGDVSAIVELETIQLILDLFQLPKTFLGGFVTGATMSNFTCLAVARQWAGREMNIDVAKNGVDRSFKILSGTPHSSSLKSLSMLGLGSSNLITVKTLDGNREAIDVADLENKLAQLNNAPCILISSGGTVNTVDFDDMQAIALLKAKYKFWWHIDAAFGAFAACSPDHQHLLSGWENADSITVDCHKWLNVPYDSAILLIKKEHRHLQVETFQNSNAPYLGDPLENFSYLNFLPENSRRFRALPAWFTLQAYGKEGYKEIVERNIAVANYFGAKIEASTDFKLLAPVRLNTVCFSLAENNTGRVTAFLNELTSRGKVFMTPTVYRGENGIRAAFVNWLTTTDDIDLIWREMKDVLELLPNS